TYTAKDIARFLRAANHDLALKKYKAKDMIPDYCKAVLIGFQLQAELATAKEENQRLLAVARLALVLDDVESIKNVLQPWKGE
ncbi:hypothetical protein LCGC14_2768310, partial [marine sediment metagenome]